MENWKIRPPLSQKPLNWSSPKFAWVIDYVGDLYPYKKISYLSMQNINAEESFIVVFLHI